MSAYQLENVKKGDTVALMHTNMGDIEIKLFPEKAPKTCENFITHSKSGYYNGIVFHRVIKEAALRMNLTPTSIISAVRYLWQTRDPAQTVVSSL